MPILDPERQSRRLQLVDEHVRLENQHDLDGIMTTFGAAPRYDDEPWMPITQVATASVCFIQNYCAPCQTCR